MSLLAALLHLLSLNLTLDSLSLLLLLLVFDLLKEKLLLKTRLHGFLLRGDLLLLVGTLLEIVLQVVLSLE